MTKIGKSAIGSCLLLGSLAIGAQPFTIRPLLLDGDPVPDRAGVQFESPERYAINGRGQAAVIANAGGVRGLWAQQTLDGPFVPLLEVGGLVPGTGGSVAESIASQPHPISEAGLTGIRFQVSGTGVNGNSKNAIVVADIETQTISAFGVSGDPAPGISGGVFDLTQFLPFLSDDGEILFSSSIFDGATSDTDALYLASSLDQQPTLVSRTGDPVPSIGADATISQVFDGVVRGPLLAFYGQYADGDSEFPGIWLGGKGRGEAELVIADGQEIPGLEPPQFFTELLFGRLSLEADGSLLFFAAVTDNGSPATRRRGIFHRSADGVLSALALEGDPAPGIAGATFRSLGGSEFSGNGHVLFNALLEGPGISFELENDNSIWQYFDGELTLLAREGDQLPAGYREGRFSLANALGQIASSGGTGTISRLSASLPNNQWFVVLENGDVLDVRGEARVVSLVDTLGFATRGGYDGFAPDGRLAFNLRFEDGTSGIFTADLNLVLFANGFELP